MHGTRVTWQLAVRKSIDPCMDRGQNEDRAGEIQYFEKAKYL